MFLKKSSNNSTKINKDDLAYISSLSAAALEKTNKKSSVLLYVTLLILFFLFLWAYFTKVDEITRGEGKVIPSGKIQVIQNLEGGIVEKILTTEGQIVKKGDILIKIKNQKFQSDFKDNKVDYDSLYIKSIRLKAEFEGKYLSFTKKQIEGRKELIRSESSLYISRKKHLKSKVDIVQNQLEAKKFELADAKSKEEFLRKNLKLLQKELLITEPLVKKGIVSEVDFLKSKRDYNQNSKELKSIHISIPKIKVEATELKNKIIEVELEFKNEAKKELNKVQSELLKLSNQKLALGDQVNRTDIRSPVNGVVKQIHVNTIGGIIKPGMDIMEIVPLNEKFIIEAKIKPGDIAFLKPNLKALVKFTAYDFSVYGGLNGKLIKISADTITDKKENSFYLIQIETDSIENNDKFSKLDIIAGMTVSVDIITGKKSILDYLLKPILKAKNNALTER